MCLVVAVLMDTVLVGPASADTDLARTGAITCYSVWTGDNNCNKINDGNDASVYQAYASEYVIYGWVYVDLGSAKYVGRVRVYAHAPGCCTLNSLHIQWSMDHVAWTDMGSMGNVGDSGVVDVPGGAVTARYFRLINFAAQDVNGFILQSYELYAPAGPATVAGTDYVYAVSMENVAFGKTLRWRWKLGFAGAWTLSRADASNATAFPATCSEQLPGAINFTPCHYTGGELSSLQRNADTCGIGGCGGPWTLTITDTGRNQNATYVFPADGVGDIIAPPTPVRITSINSCYNNLAAHCGGGESVGTIHLAFSVSGPAQHVAFGPQSPSNAYGIDGTPVYTATGITAGSWAATAIAFDPAKTRTWVLITTSDDGLTTHAATNTIKVDGTPSTTVPAVTTPDGSCDMTDPACGLRQVLGVSADAVAQAVAGAVDTVRGKMLAKQPFNFIVRAYDGVTAQITRAQSATVTSSTCSGITMTYAVPTLPPPSSYGGSFGTPAATVPPVYGAASPIPLTILRCADLEPWGGTDWWQAIRTAMGPALYLGYAYGWVRKLQPATQLAA